MSSLYLKDGCDDEGDSDGADDVVGEGVESLNDNADIAQQVTQNTQTDLDERDNLKEQLNKLEAGFRDFLTSPLNRESSFREYADTSFAKLEKAL